MKLQLVKVNQYLLLLVLLTLVLYHGRAILIPLFAAILMAMLMAPLCRRLDRSGMRRVFSCLICVLILVVFFVGMLGVVLSQVSSFLGQMPEFQARAEALLNYLQDYVERRFDVPVATQTAFLKEETGEASQYIRTYLTGFLQSSISLLVGMVITMVITFLLLFHKEKYYAFFISFSNGEEQPHRKLMLEKIGKVSQRYLVGRAVSIVALFVLYAIALVVIGIQNALLLAAVAAIFNIIPYLGPILAALFPVLIALVSEPGYQPAIWVLVSFCLFQALDNYWITPYFLGGEVNLSALSTIIGMICGGFCWGVSGMILFIPLLSMLKIVLDQVPGMAHYGMLIGDTGEPPSRHMGAWLRRLFGR